jgi:hypothetical protein
MVTNHYAPAGGATAVRAGTGSPYRSRGPSAAGEVAESDRNVRLTPPAPRRAGTQLPIDQRTLRSHGQVLSWNPTMGDQQVITSDHAPTSKVGEVDDGRCGGADGNPPITQKVRSLY